MVKTEKKKIFYNVEDLKNEMISPFTEDYTKTHTYSDAILS